MNTSISNRSIIYLIKSKSYNLLISDLNIFFLIKSIGYEYFDLKSKYYLSNKINKL
jgi:hypothetical protein